MISRFAYWPLAGVTLFILTAGAAGQESPLQTVMDGREAAGNSTLTETGLSTMAQSVANGTLYVCGALAIIFTALGLMDLFKVSEMEGMHMQANERRAAFWKLAIAGMISIPAIIAAILPYAVLGAS